MEMTEEMKAGRGERDHSTNHLVSSCTNKASGQTVAEVLSKHEKNIKVNL